MVTGLLTGASVVKVGDIARGGEGWGGITWIVKLLPVRVSLDYKTVRSFYYFFFC